MRSRSWRAGAPATNGHGPQWTALAQDPTCKIRAVRRLRVSKAEKRSPRQILQSWQQTAARTDPRGRSGRERFVPGCCWNGRLLGMATWPTTASAWRSKGRPREAPGEPLQLRGSDGWTARCRIKSEFSRKQEGFPREEVRRVAQEVAGTVGQEPAHYIGRKPDELVTTAKMTRPITIQPRTNAPRRSVPADQSATVCMIPPLFSVSTSLSCPPTCKGSIGGRV